VPPVSVLGQINPLHTLPTYFPNIHFNIISHLCLSLPSGILPSGFQSKILYTFLISPICPWQLNLYSCSCPPYQEAFFICK
jgi:hypothetical protein